ncbi:MAG TPA: hypothetical protein VIK33_02700 [Anaerolineae bacterium]
MELEQRVKALEYEMKILKNEVQRTLLDIQEQILIHYYPALRLEESGTPEGAIQALEAVHAKQASLGPPPATPPPVAKKVTLEEIRAGQREATPPSANVKAAPDPTRLSEWAGSASAKIGAQRTARLIDAAAAKGVVPEPMKDTLLRVAALNKEPAPEKVAVNDVLALLLKFYELAGRASDVEEALVVIEEANLG